MRRVNVFRPEFDHASERDGYRWRAPRVGQALGAQRIGALALRARTPASGRTRTTSTTGWRSGCSCWRARRRCAAPTASECCGPATSSASRRARRARHQVAGPGTVLLLSAEPPRPRRSSTRTAASSASRPPGQDLPRRRRRRLLGGRVSGEPVNALRRSTRRGRRGRPARLPRAHGALRAADRRRSSSAPRSTSSTRARASARTTTSTAIEEWLLVLAGTPTLRDPDGEHELEPGDLVCFPEGPEGAHKVTNRARGAARIADALERCRRRASPCTPTAARSASGRSSKLFRLDGRRRLLGRRAPEALARACTGESAGAHEQIGETSPPLPFSCR